MATPLDSAFMLEITSWTLENQDPVQLKDLPTTFLQRLWILSPDARSPCCKLSYDTHNDAKQSPEQMLNGFGIDNKSAINPLDLVTAVYMSANTFLQQEITVRMVQCQFAVPLVLPSIDPEGPSHFLLWPLRGVVSQWRSHFPNQNSKVQEGDLASACMPLVSCVKLGHCSVSKSQVLNHLLSGLKSGKDTFHHRGMDGGQLPRRLSNGLVEIGWFRPTGDFTKDIFPVPVVISNLRGDASRHEKCLNLLCQASSAVVVFCGNLREKEKQQLIACKDMTNKLILIDLSDLDNNENRIVEFDDQKLEEYIGLPEVSVIPGKALSEEELANRLCFTLKGLLPDKLKLVTLEDAAKLADQTGLYVDEGPVGKNVMSRVEEMLQGLDEGSAQFREKQLPLQGSLWSKLAELEKEESKMRKEGKETDSQRQKEKKDIIAELGSYKMTPVMKMFTSALFITDEIERMYFLTWMKLRLQQKQMAKHNLCTNPQTEKKNTSLCSAELENVVNDHMEDSDSFCTDSSFEDETTEVSPVNTAVSNDQQQEVENILVIATAQVVEQQPQNNHDLVIEMMPNEKESRCENKVLVFEEHPDKSFEDQNHCLDSGENGTFRSQKNQQDKPELTLADTSSAKPQACPEDHFASSLQPFEPNPSWLGLEHFLREMGLIFELKKISPLSGSHNVLRLPGLAADLLLRGVPLEIMDGEASNIPTRWLISVFAELKNRLSQKQGRTRVLTNIGPYHARNAEVFSALFGVRFSEGRQRSTRGVYMMILCLPDSLKKEMECDFLLLIDVEGLGLMSPDKNINTQLHDNEMATVATGLSHVLLENISSHAGSVFETDFTVIVNALLCIKEHGSMPICQLMTQDDGINSLIQATQLRRVSEMLQNETRDRGIDKSDNHDVQTRNCIPCVKGPWSNVSVFENGDKHYSTALLKLKRNLFDALKDSTAKSKASSLPEFINSLCNVWDAVKADTFSLGLQNTDIALAFSLLCTEQIVWEDSLMKHMESWLVGAAQKIFTTKAKALDEKVQTSLLSDLKNEAREEVKTEMHKIRSKAEAYLIKDECLKMNTETFKPILMKSMNDLQEHTTEEIIWRLETANERHCSSTQLKTFETLLEKEEEAKQCELIENSKLTKIILQDTELEDVFDCLWTKTLSSFDFRSSETDNITARVADILKENLISRGLQKHMKKIEVIGQNQTSSFQVTDEHFGYRSRLKHMFEDNNRIQRLEAQQVASSIIEEYNKFVADKSSLPADFSDSYIKELLENVERALSKKSMAIKSAFEVDLKVYLCCIACQDFQKLHDRFAKDIELLRCIAAGKSSYLSEFIYQFRKRDQCWRIAQEFTSMVIKPAVLDYIYRPLGMLIADEIQAKNQQYQSPRAFHQSLLEELVKEDKFESFQEYFLSYDSFRLNKIQEKVGVHLSDSTSLDKWRQQRLGEIIGKIAAAVSQTSEDNSGELSDTKPLLEKICITLERDGDVDVNKSCLEGPLLSITTEWDRFVSCLMELLAAMRLDLAQEFSQNAEISILLQCLPILPQHSIFSSVRGCDKQCPICGTPCEVEEMGHEVHMALLHRPKGILPYDSSSLSSFICPKSMNHGNPGYTNVACRNLNSHYPDWKSSLEDENSQTLSVYWRYLKS